MDWFACREVNKKDWFVFAHRETKKKDWFAEKQTRWIDVCLRVKKQRRRIGTRAGKANKMD